MMLFVNSVVTISACGVISHMEENASLKKKKEAITLNSSATSINNSYHMYTMQDIRTQQSLDIEDNLQFRVVNTKQEENV